MILVSRSAKHVFNLAFQVACFKNTLVYIGSGGLWEAANNIWHLVGQNKWVQSDWTLWTDEERLMPAALPDTIWDSFCIELTCRDGKQYCVSKTSTQSRGLSWRPTGCGKRYHQDLPFDPRVGEEDPLYIAFRFAYCFYMLHSTCEFLNLKTLARASSKP